MAIISYQEKQVVFRVAYVGIPTSGKASVLKSLHRSYGMDQRGELSHEFVNQDRLLSLDILKSPVCVIPGFKTLIRAYALPGFPVRTHSYRQTLKSIDGIAFIVDSQWDRMEENVRAFSALQEILVQQKTSLLEIPFILLYNKRDLAEAAPLDYLDMTFNRRSKSAPAFEVHAGKGVGIKESLQWILDQFANKYPSPSS